jgi:hypothetical protein
LQQQQQQQQSSQTTVPLGGDALLRVLLLANPDEDERYDALHSPVVASLLAPLLAYVDDSDRWLRDQLLPPLPMGVTMAPTLKFLPPVDQITSTFLYKATRNYYSRELYLLEKLLQCLLTSARVKTLKVPESLTGFGLTESVVPDCVAATDVLALVTKWREMLLHDAAARAAAAAAAAATAASGGAGKPRAATRSRATTGYYYDDDDDDDDGYGGDGYGGGYGGGGRSPKATATSPEPNKVR